MKIDSIELAGTKTSSKFSNPACLNYEPKLETILLLELRGFDTCKNQIRRVLSIGVFSK